jgi:hypothetical protein
MPTDTSYCVPPLSRDHDLAARKFFGYFSPKKLTFTKDRETFDRKLLWRTIVPAYLTGHTGVCYCRLGPIPAMEWGRPG